MLIRKINIFFALIFLFKMYSPNNIVYRIPFGLYNIKQIYNENDVINNIFNNIIYVNLSIGTPPQIVPFILNMNSQTFTVYEKVFNKNLSSTYKELSKLEILNDNEDISSGMNSKDILNINNQKKEINFIFSEVIKFKDYPFGILGLLIPNNIQEGVYPFLNSLKEEKIINSFTWSLKYFNNISLLTAISVNKNNNNIIGEFIFGNEPHYYEEDKSKYNKSQLIKINPLSSYDFSWDITFDIIYLSLKINQNNIQSSNIMSINLNGRTKLAPEVGFIFIPKEFDYILKRQFFKKYFIKNICKSKISDEFYEFIECSENSSFNISSFPDIYFEHKEFGTNFTLTYEDLFIHDKLKSKYIFLMLNDKYISGWIFGSIFLRKYQLIFNQDSKTIGYYKSINYINSEYIDDNIKDKRKSKSNAFIKVIFLILFIAASLLLILIGMHIQKKYCYKNRIKAKELEDRFNFSKKKYQNKNEILLY